MQLTREAIIGEAMNILDSYGLGDLTMRRLARHLEVVPGALYWHLPNKQSLLEALAAEIVRPVTEISLRDDAQTGVDKPGWLEQSSKVSDELRSAMNSHRDGAEVVSAALAMGSLRRTLVEIFLEALKDANLESQTRETAAQTLLDFIVGSTLNEQSERQLRQATSGNSDSSSATPSDWDSTFHSRLSLVLAGVSSFIQLR